MKKEYVIAEIEILNINFGDIITASGDAGPIDPGADQNNPFGGGYDSNGWT